MTTSTRTEILRQTTIKTPLGEMLAIATNHALCLLEFKTRPDLDRQIVRISRSFELPLLNVIKTTTTHRHAIFKHTQSEIDAYFNGTLRQFKTPLDLRGTPLQIQVWEHLRKIPSGKTINYTQLAKTIGHPLAVRAVAAANAANRIAIIIPCHRVIRKTGHLAGYAGGIKLKQTLLDHETKHHLVAHS